MIEYLYYALVAFVTFFLYAQPAYFSRLFDWIFRKTPPGPFSFPLIGARGIDAVYPWKTFTEWGQKNGGMCSMFLGVEFTIVLTDKDIIKEAMVNPAFEGRPLNMASRKILKSKGLSYADGQLWAEQRRFSIPVIKQLGGAPGRLEQDEPLQHAAAELVAYITSQNGRPFDCRRTFDRAVTSATARFLQDGVISVSDDHFPRFIEALKGIFVMSENVGILNIFPWLKHVPPFRDTQKVLEKSLGYICELSRNNVAKRKLKGVPSKTRDILDALIQQQAKEDPKTTNFTDEQLEILLSDMLLAAVEDLIVVLMWVVVALLNFPEVQTKCQRLLDEVVGRNRSPSLKDRPELGYIDAVIWETIRFSNAVPFPFPRRITETVKFRGYNLPKDSVVITNAYAVGFNEEYWGDSMVFRPERFLNDDGKFIQSPLVLAFGAGRRVCVGTAYSQFQMWMFTSTILQNFRLEPARNEPPPSFANYNFGIMLTPHDFDIQATPR